VDEFGHATLNTKENTSKSKKLKIGHRPFTILYLLTKNVRMPSRLNKNKKLQLKYIVLTSVLSNCCSYQCFEQLLINRDLADVDDKIYHVVVSSMYFWVGILRYTPNFWAFTAFILQFEIEPSFRRGLTDQ
jgi:hypothetical protein